MNLEIPDELYLRLKALANYYLEVYGEERTWEQDAIEELDWHVSEQERAIENLKHYKGYTKEELKRMVAQSKTLYAQMVRNVAEAERDWLV